MPKANAKHNASDSCEGGPAEKQPRANICIIHTEGIKDCGRITLISNLPDPTRRFHEICDIRDRRLRAPSNSSERRQYSCSLVPNALEDHHGYHRNCYKWFVNHLDKLPVHDDNEPSPSLSEDPSTSARRSGNIGKVDHVLFQEDCIFCNKDGRIRVKVAGTWVHQDTTLFEYGGGHTIIDIATNRNDEKLLTRIRGQDLFAREAHYHPTCRKKYTSDPRLWNSKDHNCIISDSIRCFGCTVEDLR